jgi:hypothetical protein
MVSGHYLAQPAQESNFKDLYLHFPRHVFLFYELARLKNVLINTRRNVLSQDGHKRTRDTLFSVKQ